MEATELINQGLVWFAASDNSSPNPLEKIDPESILAQGYSHEFFLGDSQNIRDNIYPVSVLLPFIKALHDKNRENKKENKFIVFLGKEVWPTPFCLRDTFSTDLPLTNFLFVDSKSDKNRRRLLEIIASSTNVLGVVTFLRKPPFSFTQKLHLLSKQSHTSTLIFRNNKEIYQKSAAYSRWIITPTISNTDFPSWKILLQHTKGACVGERIWLMEGVNEEKVSVHLLSELVGRSNTTDFAIARCA